MALLLALAASVVSAPLVANDEGPLAFFIDADYEWRSRDQTGWQAFGASFRLPWSLFAAGEGRDRYDLHWFKSGVSARYERSYGESPNAERIMVGAILSAGVDESWRFADMSPDSDLSYLGIPFHRSRAGGFGVTTTLGWVHSRGTQQPATETQDALRLEQALGLSFSLIGFRAVGAININLRNGPDAVWEYGLWVTVGADYLPAGLAIGYHHLGTERAGGGTLSLRLILQL